MKIYIISDDTRLNQESIFLETISKSNNLDIVYCALKGSNINENYYKNILFSDKDNILKSIKSEKKSNIIFLNYYGNLDNFNFEGYNLIIFGHYAFYKQKISFIGLKEICFFNFFRIELSRKKITELFENIKINYISDINYPSSINYNLHRKDSVNLTSDITVPLGGKVDFDILFEIIKHYKDLNFTLFPINHPYFDNFKSEKQYLYKFLLSIKGFKNISLGKMASENLYSSILTNSKIILLPLKEHWHDLTRISDTLSLGKVIITSRVPCTIHINGLMISEGINEFIDNIDKVLFNKLYLDKLYKDNIIEIYDKNHSIEKLTLDLYKFLIDGE